MWNWSTRSKLHNMYNKTCLVSLSPNWLCATAVPSHPANCPEKEISSMAAVLMPTSVSATLAEMLTGSAQVQQEVSQLTEQQRLIYDRLLQDSQARLLLTVNACVTQADAGAEAHPIAPLSPFLRPLPAPPVDDEVHALESQVTKACQRVAELRAAVPKQLGQQLSQHLQQCRPADTSDKQPTAAFKPSGAITPEGTPDSQEAAVQQSVALYPTHLKPAPSQLQKMYSTAVQKMPALRAKLGEALERMNRVVQAIEQDALQPSPYPAQLARNMQQADTDTMSPALQQALQTGQVTTRKAAPKDLHPVPFGM